MSDLPPPDDGNKIPSSAVAQPAPYSLLFGFVGIRTVIS